MDRAAGFRRIFHVLSPVFLSYYLLPDQIAPNLTKLSLAILFVGTAGCIEIARIALGIRLFGMRPYEGQRVSAYAQGLLGLVIGIFVVQDPRIVVPVFLGMAWIDPLRSIARKRRWPVALPIAAYAILFFVAQTLIPGIPSVTARVMYAAIATTVAMAMEGPRIPQIDDDLSMQLLPLAALIVAMALIPTAGLP
jgi:hypothetical protein